MIHLIVPAFNSFSALCLCLGSIYAQDHKDMKVVVIDDASTDDRIAPLVQKFCDQQGWTAIINPVNLQCPQNLVLGIEASDPAPDDIIFILDGDDWLPHQRVLSHIVEVYSQNPATWLTYGSYVCVPADSEAPTTSWYPLETVLARTYRTHPITLFNHPITFKKFLWDALDPESDFKYPDKTWVEGVYDEAIMYPMLEMATNHYQRLGEILYVYNSNNPLSVKYSMPEKVRRAGEFLRSLPIKPLMRLEGDGLLEEPPEPDEEIWWQ